jgi:hypothetical protein
MNPTPAEVQYVTELIAEFRAYVEARSIPPYKTKATLPCVDLSKIQLAFSAPREIALRRPDLRAIIKNWEQKNVVAE